MSSQAESATGAMPLPQQMRALMLAVLLGAAAAAAASAFLWVVDAGQRALYEDLPRAFGMDAVPWWWIAILLAAGATVVALARRLPGATGMGPLTGFHFDDPPSIVPSVLLAALGTLLFGFVLGPEAPLIVLGSAVGALATRRAEPQVQKAAMFLGGIAAIGAVFGNPFVTGFMMLEFAAIGMLPAVLVLPGLVALASSYLVQIGIWGIPGFGVHSLAVPGLPEYPQIQFGDLGLAVVVAAVAGLIAVLARRGGDLMDRASQRRPVPTLYLAAAITLLVVLIVHFGFGAGIEQVLFSGNSGMSGLVQETSFGLVLVILAGKWIAYSASLGGGLRGGPIFPATFLGVAVGVGAALLFPSISVSPLVAAGIAACAAAFIGLPATSALLATLLVAGAGAAIAPFAILGAAVGIIIRIATARLLVRPTS